MSKIAITEFMLDENMNEFSRVFCTGIILEDGAYKKLSTSYFELANSTFYVDGKPVEFLIFHPREYAMIRDEMRKKKMVENIMYGGFLGVFLTFMYHYLR